MPAESLVPGYRLVGAFGLDSEYETRSRVNPEGDKDGAEEVEEQVEYVTLEISGIADVDPSLLTSYRLIVSSGIRSFEGSPNLNLPPYCCVNATHSRIDDMSIP